MARTLTTPPSDLDAASKKLWKRLVAALTDQGTFNAETDVDLLERYVRAIELGRVARRELAAADSMWTVGSTGQPAAHPAVKVIRDAGLDADRFAAALLLTPQTRKRHEIAPREAAGELDGVL